MLIPVTDDPGSDHARSQAKEGQKPGDWESAAGLLHVLLRVDFLILRRIGHGEASAIDGGDTQTAPKVALRDSLLGALEQSIVDGIEPIEGQLSSGTTIRAGFVCRDGFVLGRAESDRLADGVAAGGTGLGGLPEEGPEGELKGPETVSREGAVILLGESECWDPVGSQELELVEGILRQAEEFLRMMFEIAGPGRKERS